MIKIILPLSFVLISATLALAAPAGANAAQAKAQLRKYCTGDALSYCGDLDSDDQAMKACFRANRAKLSENCRRAIDAFGRAAGG